MRSSRSATTSLVAHDADEQREPLLVGHLCLGLAGSLVGGHARLLPRRAQGDLTPPVPLCDGPHSAPAAAVGGWPPFVIAG